MKKSLIALAVLAASGAALAQSSVTVYGIADVVVHKDKNVSTTLTSGGVSASRIGFKGTEDLGGGLKANFVLEQGFDLVTGDQSIANKAFGREASVGLSGAFGSVKLGRMSTAFDTNEGAGFAAFYSVLNPANEWAGYTNGRHDGGVYYSSPDISGFSADISTNITSAANDTHTAMVLKYSAGPLYAAYLYQKDDVAVEKQNRIEVNYDFGMATALFAYDKLDAAGVKSKQYTLGANVPVSAQMTLSGGFASTETAGVRVNGWSLAAAYSLSKRTTVYGGFYGDNGVAGTTLDSRYGVGLKHTF